MDWNTDQSSAEDEIPRCTLPWLSSAVRWAVQRRLLGKRGDRRGRRERSRRAAQVRSPARPLVLLAARRRAEDRRSRQARRGRPAAGAGAHRHQQSVRGAGILREARRDAACSRSSGCSSPSISSRVDPTPAAGASPAASIVLLAQTEEGYGNLMRAREPGLFRRAPRRRAAVFRPLLSPSTGRAHRLTGGPRGPARRGARIGGRARPCRGALEHAEARLRRPALCRDPAARPGGRTPQSRRALIDLADRHGAAARRDQRALLRRRRLRGPRRAARRRRRPLRLRREPAPAARPSTASRPGRDGDAVRRPARGAARTPSRSRCAAPFGCARASRSCRASAPATAAEALDEDAELRRQAEEGLEARLRRHGPAPGLTEEDYRERLAFELSVIARMKYPGYFLIVADFIKWAKAPGHPGRAGARLRRRLPRRLRAHHHRPRPAALRAALRALPQSRARLDAGLRHRLLRRSGARA